MRAAERIRIAAGGGVTLANAPELCRIGHLDVHASLRIKGVPASGTDPLWDKQTSAGMDISAQDVRALAAIVHGVPSPLKGSRIEQSTLRQP